MECTYCEKLTHRHLARKVLCRNHSTKMEMTSYENISKNLRKSTKFIQGGGSFDAVSYLSFELIPFNPQAMIKFQ